MFNTNWKQDWDTKVKLEDELNTKLYSVQGGKYLNDLLNQYKEFKEYSGNSEFRTFIDVCYPDNTNGVVRDCKVFGIDDIVFCDVDFSKSKVKTISKLCDDFGKVFISLCTQNKCIGEYQYDAVTGCVKMISG